MAIRVNEAVRSTGCADWTTCAGDHLTPDWAPETNRSTSPHGTQGLPGQSRTLKAVGARLNTGDRAGCGLPSGLRSVVLRNDAGRLWRPGSRRIAGGYRGKRRFKLIALMDGVAADCRWRLWAGACAHVELSTGGFGAAWKGYADAAPRWLKKHEALAPGKSAAGGKRCGVEINSAEGPERRI